MTTDPSPGSDRPQRSDDSEPPTKHGVAGGRPGMAYRHMTYTRR